ncbi:hypothetical protein SFC43_33110 [Bacteroides sp. CR5/BHMF/2]|nr:hypothetical protein [Bacteroides sp. CR5/BHMF/2]
MDIIEAGRTIFLKVSRTLRFHAPYVGQASMAYQFLLPDPIPSLPTYTWEVKIYATQFRSSGASGTTRVCSFGGSEASVEGERLMMEALNVTRTCFVLVKERMSRTSCM